jgi:hypothetical protein
MLAQSQHPLATETYDRSARRQKQSGVVFVFLETGIAVVPLREKVP